MKNYIAEKRIPDKIPFMWEGKYFHGEKWKEEDLIFTEILTDERKGITTARAYRSFSDYYGEMDHHSMMPAYSSTRENNLFFKESSNPNESVEALYNWLVKNDFIDEKGKPTKIIHNQDKINNL